MIQHVDMFNNMTRKCFKIDVLIGHDLNDLSIGVGGVP